MDASPLFCSGLELGNLAVSSGLIHRSWSKILELNGSIDPSQDSNLRVKIYEEAKYTVVAFVAPPICTRRSLFGEDGSVNSALTLLDGSSGSDVFRFLFSDNISSFSVHSPAYQLFASVYDHLVDLKSQLLGSEKPLIITGFELGGSVASLFTLLLLDTIKPGRKRPLCITFGSPLIGDASLQQILENSIRNSCFLHVVSIQYLFRELLFLDSNSLIFKPFGTFLLCCESECICIEDPDAVLELLASINGGLTSDDKWNVYDEILRCLERSSVLTGAVSPGESVSNRLLAGMFLQPDHFGRGRTQDNQEAHLICNVIMKMEDRASAKGKLQFDPFKKLNDHMKINMAHLEWYKKICRNEEIGYYDHLKRHVSRRIPPAELLKKELTDYWKSIVEAAEKMPQSEKAALRKRFLYAGNNYRRMVEPLDIAEHYRDNSSMDYIRSRHYAVLQNWFEEAEKQGKVSLKRVLTDLLTLDSCFWARVEKAIIWIGMLKNGGTRDGDGESLTGKLGRFEEYVWEEIGKHTVSPEIFLKSSTFMRWWEEYRKFKGDDYESPFADFMNQRRYRNYGMP